MRSRGFLFFLLAVICGTGSLHAETKQKTIKRKPASDSTANAPVIRQKVQDPDDRFYVFKLNTGVGINIISGGNSGIMMGGQAGFAPAWNVPFYIGPEVNFTYFSNTSLLMALGTAWYELKVYGAPRLSLAFGAQAGGAFNSGLPNLPNTGFAAFLDTAIGQEVTDLVQIRGQFRPGVIGGYFAFLMDVNVQFRF